jgi:hypothetical protein
VRFSLVSALVLATPGNDCSTCALRLSTCAPPAQPT